jgi:hypothetical protein
LNRPVIAALILAFFPLGALAQISEDPEAKQRRVDVYQDRRIIVEPDPEDKGGKKDAADAATARGRKLLLRQGPDRIYQVDFVELMADPSLSAYWGRERAKDWAIWLGTGAIGVPAGTLLFLQNFRGEGSLAAFSETGREQAANAGDLRAYALSVLGAGIALYGAYNLGLWVLENLDVHHPDRLDAEAIEPRAREFNEKLRERLNLDPEDIPSPPTPRPSPSPSPSVDPFDEEGIDASPPVGGPGADPYGGDPIEMPTPMPLVVPGVVPSVLVPTPEPRPSIFKFYPGQDGYPVPSMRPDPNATAAPATAAPAEPPAAEPAPSPAPSAP